MSEAVELLAMIDEHDDRTARFDASLAGVELEGGPRRASDGPLTGRADGRKMTSQRAARERAAERWRMRG